MTLLFFPLLLPPPVRRAFAFAVLLVAILMFGYFGSTSFIYFQF